MGKALSEMTLEELWQLFPIFLTEHSEAWNGWFEEERDALTDSLPMDEIVRISQIGSTAVPGIWAKPIVDILIEVRPETDFTRIAAAIQDAGYTQMSSGDNRISFNKGYTADGFAKKVFHLHLRYQGDHDELYFRDYLNDHPDMAKEYEQLKLELWPLYEHDRDGYTNSKSDFIKNCTKKGKDLYAGRYTLPGIP